MSLLIDEKEIDSLPITMNAEVLSGTPVFRGTRVPVDALLSNIEAGLTVEEFLENVPTSPGNRRFRFCGFPGLRYNVWLSPNEDPVGVRASVAETSACRF
jgi:uncharacterized protein (DUF433 family)